MSGVASAGKSSKKKKKRTEDGKGKGKGKGKGTLKKTTAKAGGVTRKTKASRSGSRGSSRRSSNSSGTKDTAKATEAEITVAGVTWTDKREELKSALGETTVALMRKGANGFKRNASAKKKARKAGKTGQGSGNKAGAKGKGKDGGNGAGSSSSIHAKKSSDSLLQEWQRLSELRLEKERLRQKEVARQKKTLEADNSYLNDELAVGQRTLQWYEHRGYKVYVPGMPSAQGLMQDKDGFMRPRNKGWFVFNGLHASTVGRVYLHKPDPEELERIEASVGTRVTKAGKLMSPMRSVDDNDAVEARSIKKRQSKARSKAIASAKGKKALQVAKQVHLNKGLLSLASSVDGQDEQGTSSSSSSSSSSGESKPVTVLTKQVSLGHMHLMDEEGTVTRHAPKALSEAVSLEGRFVGSMVGMAVADALGSQFEFQPWGSFKVEGMLGGGPHKLEPGMFTDDTSMALCLAASLASCGEFDALDQVKRYRRWWKEGYMSANGKCFDIGATVKAGITRSKWMREPLMEVWADEERKPYGNGSIMRLSPVVLWCYGRESHERALQLAGESSLTTHASINCVECCQLLAHLLWGLLDGESKKRVLSTAYMEQAGPFRSSLVQELVQGTWKDKSPPDGIRGLGNCVATMEVALWALHGSEDFESGCVMAVEVGGDTDTTACVYGQLAGALYGVERIPGEWVEVLAKRSLIEKLARKMMVASSGDGE